MKKIVLKGNNDTGKSSTIKEFIHLFLKNKARLIMCSANFGHFIQKWDRVGEVWVLLEFDNKIIFITTYGDCQSLIKYALDSALSYSNLLIKDIDVFVGACHPTGNAKKFIENLEGDEPVYIDKIKSAQSENCNSLDIATAKSMFDVFLSVVK